MAQLWGAIGAIFSSWMNPRAITYRLMHNIPPTGARRSISRAMVFGNLGNASATGVAFTRNPSTGENALYGEFLVNAQGEDVVAGIRTPQSITEKSRIDTGSEKPSLEKLMPEAYRDFVSVCHRLEAHYRDMLDLEFTIERGKLWMLQVRWASAPPGGAEDRRRHGGGGADFRRGCGRPHRSRQPRSTAASDHRSRRPRDVIGSGLPASPGAASGEIVFTSEGAVAAEKEGRKVILVRTETSPEDIHGMHAAQGILTTRGGMTSHAAVVARGMGLPCVCGVGSLRVDIAQSRTDRARRQAPRRRHHLHRRLLGPCAQGLSAHAAAGTLRRFRAHHGLGRSNQAHCGCAPTRRRPPTPAPPAPSAPKASASAARNICSSNGDRIAAMREMIIAETVDKRRAALKRLLPMQKADFVELFEIMHGLPVTIRLSIRRCTSSCRKARRRSTKLRPRSEWSRSHFRERIEALHEFNPMLGHRGCRLHISHPEIVEMQARAIFEAAVEAARKTGEPVEPEIMVPVVGLKSELDYVKARIDEVARSVIAESGLKIAYLVGTMIELPRAALRAHVIAEVAEFFSYGTNDLTQTTFGMSRDDASSFLPTYMQKGIIERDPFVNLDFDGVGELIQIAAERGRRTRPGLKLGISAANMAATRSRSISANNGPGLRLLLPLPRADRPTRGGAGHDQEREEAVA